MHAITHVLMQLCKALGLPEWAALFVVVPLLLVGGVGAVLIRRTYFKVLKRKIKPYGGKLRHGLFFWAPTAYFNVDGVPGQLPWCSLFGMTRVRFDRLMSAGRLVVDTGPISSRERQAFRGEDLAADDRIFSARFQAVAAPGAFGSAFLDVETRKRLIALLQMSRVAMGRGKESTPKGRLRIEIDGKSMRIALEGMLGTPEIEALLAHAAALCRRVRLLSDPAAAPR